jgi:hypothetical protein
MPPRIPLHVKLDVRPLNVAPRQLRRLQPLHFLLSRSRLRGTRARGKPRDEILQLRDFLFAIGVVRFDPRTFASSPITMSSYPPYIMIVS